MKVLVHDSSDILLNEKQISELSIMTPEMEHIVSCVRARMNNFPDVL